MRGIAFIFGVVLLGALLTYQNCAPTSSGGSPFNLGSTQPLNVSAIQISQSSILPSGAFTASASVVSSAAVTCQWILIDASNAVVSTSSNVASSNLCSYSGTAPTTVGNYSLHLVAATAQNQTAQQIVNFTVSTTAPTPPPVGPTPTPTPTSAPSCLASGGQCYECVSSGCVTQVPPGSCGTCCSGSYHVTTQPITQGVILNIFYCN